LLHYLIKKSYLKDLIPDNYVDFHSHLLPGIDDGAKFEHHSVELITSLSKLGFEQFITTPHIMKNVWDNTFGSIHSKCIETKEILQNKGIEVPLKCAAEYLMDGNFSEIFKTGPLLTLKDNYVLVEMSYINPPIQLYEILFELQVAGYKPVLAHPERYLFFHQNFSQYEKLKNAGCLFQLNLLSTVGYYGEEVAMTAKKLLKKGLIDYVSSDVHHSNHVAAFSKKIMFKDAVALKEAFAANTFFRF